MNYFIWISQIFLIYYVRGPVVTHITGYIHDFIENLIKFQDIPMTTVPEGRLRRCAAARRAKE